MKELNIMETHRQQATKTVIRGKFRNLLYKSIFLIKPKIGIVLKLQTYNF